MPFQRDPNELLTAKEAADEIKVSIHTIRKYCRHAADPLLTSKRIGGRLRIRRADLYEWVERYTAKGQRDSRF